MTHEFGNTPLGDRMKEYEKRTSLKLMPLCPIVARVDGRGFSRMCRDMDKPFDARMREAMIETAKKLAEETNSILTYHQSDEITFLWYSEDMKSQVWFDGKHSKMVSQLSALATLFFYREVLKRFPEKYANRLPSFDARVWSVPNKQEACNVFLWRESDCTRNSVQMAARANFSHSECQGKNTSQLQDMLHEIGINWNNYPVWAKRGTYIRKQYMELKYSEEELNSLPEKHFARRNPDSVYLRGKYVELDVPPFSQIQDKMEFVFDG